MRAQVLQVSDYMTRDPVGILTDNDLVHALVDALRGNKPDRQA